MFARLSSIAGICPLEGTWCAAAVITTFTNMSSHKYTATGDPMSISSDVIHLEWCRYIHYEETGVGKHAVLLLPGALGSTTTDF